MLRYFAAVAVVCAVASSSFAGATLDGLKDSNDFTYKYEGDVLPDAAGFGFVLNDPNGVVGDTVSINSGVLTIDTVNNSTANDGLWYQITGGGGTAWDVAGGTALTVEIRVRINNSNSGTLGGGISLQDTNNAGFVQLFFDHIRVEGTDIATDLNNDGFHTFRFATYTPDLTSAGQIYKVWRDGVQIGGDVPVSANFSGAAFRLGDFVSGFAETDLDIDYLRWDLTGAYEPIPEPASLGLIAVGALLFGTQNRRVERSK